MESRYNRYSDYIKKQFGQRVQKITVDAGFTCPNRDGTVGNGGCIYCNNAGFSPAHLRGVSISEQISKGMELARRRYKTDNFFVYFQSFTNTHAPVEKLDKLYREALSHSGVVGLAIGTRPDCVDDEKLDCIAELSKDYDITIEYGLESISNETLEKINRGHDFEAFLNAVEMSAKRGLRTCAHIIFGFPWEDSSIPVKTAQVLSNLPIQFIKLHQLQVVKDTLLEKMYLNDPFKLPSKDEYINILVGFLENLNPEIVIQRLGGETKNDLLVAPRWQIGQAELSALLVKEMIKRDSIQGKLHKIQ